MCWKAGAPPALIASDLEQLTPAFNPNVENFYMQISPTVYSYSPVGITTTQTLSQSRLSSGPIIFNGYAFITRYNQQWNIIGYRVDSSGRRNGIGTLYRYSLNNIPVNGTIPPPTQINANSNLMSVINDFITSGVPTNNFTRVIDGVIDFRVRALDPNGNVIPGQTNNFGITASTNTLTGEFYFYRFMSNAVPAYVEAEMGILETRTLQRYYSMTKNAANPRCLRAKLPYQPRRTGAYVPAASSRPRG